MEPGEGARQGPAAGDALTALRYGWGEAYEIEVAPDGEWRARRRDGLGEWETAADPDELWRLIRANYGLKPVPRRDRPDADGDKVLGADPGALLAGG